MAETPMQELARGIGKLQARCDRAEAVCKEAVFLKDCIDAGGYMEGARPGNTASLWVALSAYLAGKGD